MDSRERANELRIKGRIVFWSLASLCLAVLTVQWFKDDPSDRTNSYAKEQPKPQLTTAEAKSALKALFETPDGHELAQFNQQYNNILETWGTNDQAYFVDVSLDLAKATYRFSSPRQKARSTGGIRCGTHQEPVKHFRGSFLLQDGHWIASPPMVVWY